MTLIDNLTKADILSGQFPLIDLLDNSLYYPSCGFDGAIVKHYSKTIIAPGTGFGFNWTNFLSKDGPLAWVVLNNQYGIPGTIIYGGYCGYPSQNERRYEDFTWKEYQMNGTINPYRTQTDKVTIWGKK
jgi:hypothetical protein